VPSEPLKRGILLQCETEVAVAITITRVAVSVSVDYRGLIYLVRFYKVAVSVAGL
jgi:hypothetical protein